MIDRDFWYASIEGIIFTKMRDIVEPILAERYPGETIYFTSQQEVNHSAEFPTIYFRQIDSDQAGLTLDGTSVNALLARFQCEVYSPLEDQAKDISFIVMRAMVSLGFESYFTPKGGLSRDMVIRVVARYRRYIGVDDTDITDNGIEEENP